MFGKTPERDKKFAGLIKAYKKAFNAVRGEVKMTFPVTRVILVDRTRFSGTTERSEGVDYFPYGELCQQDLKLFL